MAMPPGQAGRRYAKEFGLAMVAYTLAVLASVAIVRANDQASWRWAVVLLPMVPIAFVLRAVVRHLRNMDELQRRIQFEALAFAFAAGSFVTLTIGFLQVVGLPAVPWIWVWPVFALFWGIGVALAQRRYAGPER
jgi:hypothetical protein